MRTVSKTVFTFDELSDSAKEKAIESYWDCNVDHEWWDGNYGYIDEAAKILGIEIDRYYASASGRTENPEIFFSGFGNQGDGLSFNAYYSYAKGCKAKIAKEFPHDKKLQKIASDLIEAQKPLGYQGTARVTSTRNHGFNYNSDCEKISEAISDFAHWAYCLLEKNYEYLTSREAIIESIEANGYEFDEDGDPA